MKTPTPKTRDRSARKPVNLALQGGGAHGALTWGVLDRILEDGRLAIVGVSGTSAGAMNAAVLADGYERGGAETARAALHDFWKAVSDAALLSPIRRSLWDKMWGRHSLDYSPGYLFMENLSRMFSPYELNPLDINPLRDIVTERIDFDKVNSCRHMHVFVTATNVRTGRPRIFGQGEVSVDSVMASACLPQMYPAVEIDGEAYWDGGFSGNPALYPLVNSLETPDVVVVQINPMVRREVPRTARDIINRVNEVSFNSSLIKELRTLAMVERIVAEKGLDLGPLGHTYLHMIHLDEEVEDLSASSKLNAEWGYLQLLFERGRAGASRWLEEHYDAIGARSTLDLSQLEADAPHDPLERAAKTRV